MGKHTKLPAPKSPATSAMGAAQPARQRSVKPARKGDELASVEALLMASVSALQAAIASGTATPAIAREAATVARALVALRADRRAAERQAAKHANAITPSMLLDHLRRMTVAERAQLRRDLDAIDRQQSASIFG